MPKSRASARVLSGGENGNAKLLHRFENSNFFFEQIIGEF